MSNWKIEINDNYIMVLDCGDLYLLKAGISKKSVEEVRFWFNSIIKRMPESYIRRNVDDAFFVRDYCICIQQNKVFLRDLTLTNPEFECLQKVLARNLKPGTELNEYQRARTTNVLSTISTIKQVFCVSARAWTISLGTNVGFIDIIFVRPYVWADLFKITMMRGTTPVQVTQTTAKNLYLLYRNNQLVKYSCYRYQGAKYNFWIRKAKVSGEALTLVPFNRFIFGTPFAYIKKSEIMINFSSSEKPSISIPGAYLTGCMCVDVLLLANQKEVAVIDPKRATLRAASIEKNGKKIKQQNKIPIEDVIKISSCGNLYSFITKSGNAYIYIRNIECYGYNQNDFILVCVFKFPSKCREEKLTNIDLKTRTNDLHRNNHYLPKEELFKIKNKFNNNQEIDFPKTFLY